jgi:hypothetical protein
MDGRSPRAGAEGGLDSPTENSGKQRWATEKNPHAQCHALRGNHHASCLALDRSLGTWCIWHWSAKLLVFTQNVWRMPVSEKTNAGSFWAWHVKVDCFGRTLKPNAAAAATPAWEGCWKAVGRLLGCGRFVALLSFFAQVSLNVFISSHFFSSHSNTFHAETSASSTLSQHLCCRIFCFAGLRASTWTNHLNVNQSANTPSRGP